jgi:hypothetical protein
MPVSIMNETGRCSCPSVCCCSYFSARGPPLKPQTDETSVSIASGTYGSCDADTMSGCSRLSVVPYKKKGHGR